MAEGTRMKTIEENIRKLEQLQQQQAAMLNRWRNSTNLSFDESSQKLEGQRIHSEGPQAQEQSEDGGNAKPEAILEVPFVAIVEPNEDETHPRSENELQQQSESISRIVVGRFDDPKSTSFLSEILAIQPLVVNTTEIVSYKPLVSNFEENSDNLKKQEEDQWLIEELPMGNPEQFPDMVGSTRNFPGDLPQESRDISSSLDSKFKEGNSKFSTFDLVVLDGMERSGWVMNCENWNFHGLDDNLGVGNLELHPLIVKDSVGFKEFKYMANVQEVFDDMPTRGVLVLDALFDEEIPLSKYVEFISLTLPYDRGKLKLRIGGDDVYKLNTKDALVTVFSGIFLSCLLLE